MLKLKNFILDGDILTMTVLIEDKAEQSYKLSVNTKEEYFDVISSEIPKNKRRYETQACIALTNYRGKELPETIVSAWY